MIEKYKIVCNTAAGRRRYMQYLLPPILACDIVDRYDIWVNTNDVQDIEFFKLIAQKYSKVNLVWQPDGVVNGIKSINAFYKSCVEQDTIYFKLDDDIIWMEPDAIEKMVRFRIDHPGYFLVSPLVINNALSTYILECTGKIELSTYMNARADHDIIWKNGLFAAELHDWFLISQLPEKNYKNLYCGYHPVAMNRFSINAVLWFGDVMKGIDGIVPGDDEEFLSSIFPTQLGMANCFNGDAIISHFAFFPQREDLDKKNILNRYGAYLHKEWSKDPILGEIDEAIQSMMKSVSERKEEICKQSSPYKIIPKKKKTWRSFVYANCPPEILALTLRIIHRKKSYILK